MRSLELPDTTLTTTAVGYGCASLFHEPSRAQRLRLLELAYDSGIRHFDVAPMYGLGAAERELGRFARGRDGLVIATKFGIAPTAFASALSRVQRPVRSIFTALPRLGELTRARVAGPASSGPGRVLYTAHGYSAAAARASLEASLRELGTDHVELLFLHDPTPGAGSSDDVRAFLEDARTAGSIVAWGVAGEPEPSVAVARSLGDALPVLQVRDNVFLRTRRAIPDAVAHATITFGMLGGALPRLYGSIRGDAKRRRRWSDAVGVDCADSGALASLLLRDALRENARGVVLFGSSRPERILAAARAATRDPDAPDEALDAFRALLEAERGAPAEEAEAR